MLWITAFDALLGDKSLKRATVGVEIIRLGAQASDDKVVYQRAAQTPLIPARASSSLSLLARTMENPTSSSWIPVQ